MADYYVGKGRGKGIMDKIYVKWFRGECEVVKEFEVDEVYQAYLYFQKIKHCKFASNIRITAPSIELNEVVRGII